MLISVIVPTYNRSKLLLECVYSILNQSYNNLEVIIVSDGSTDDTEGLISLIKDDRVVFKQLKKNYGYPAKARNEGIKLAKGEFIAFCDDDDLWENNKIFKQVELLNMGYDFIFSNFKFIDAKKNSFKTFYLKYIVYFIINVLNRRISYLFFSITNPVVNSSVLLSKHHLQKYNFNESVLYRASEDYYLWIQIYLQSKPYYLNHELVKYRVHETNISHDFHENLKRCILVMRDFTPTSINQNILKKLGLIFYKTRTLLNKFFYSYRR
jgi:teichuronic acid biosynthesis glycosyltransferase TuaG